MRAFAARDVRYLQGGNDTCACAKPSSTCACESHGLEVTCADELGGPWRLARGRRYFAALQAYYDSNATALAHTLHVVPNVGHDHSQLWQSREGLSALFADD